MTASTVDTTAPQVAINDIGTEEDLLAAIDATIKHFNDGDIVEGRIVKVDRDEVLLDIGYKTEGVIPSRELSIKHDVDPNDVVSVGDEVEALVLQKEDKEGRLILSKKRAQYERAWGTIEKIKEEDGVVTGSVIEVVKGGLILDIGLRGFLPASLVEMRRVRDLQPYVGKEIEAKIIELDKNRNNVVLSRRAWLEQTQSEVRTTFLKELGKGQVRSGVVSSIVNFGAFVDSAARRCVEARSPHEGGRASAASTVSDPRLRAVVRSTSTTRPRSSRYGDEVTVEVLDVDMDRERVSLSAQRRRRTGGTPVAALRRPDTARSGSSRSTAVGCSRSSTATAGAGHSASWPRAVELPEQVVTVGTDIFVKVIDIDLERRRISLSLKQANEDGANQVEFDPTLYGMAAEYDEAGNYKYPEGRPRDEWLEGFEKQRETWEKQYAEAHARWEAPCEVEAFAKADAEAAGGSDATSYSSESAARRPTRAAPPARRHRRPRAPSPPTRRSPPCARSSPATEPTGVPQWYAGRSPHEARSPHVGGRASPCPSPPRPRARSRGPAPVGRTGSAKVADMLRVGLTGGIGSGKSTVSAQLASLGAVVVDADAVAREVVEPGTPALAAVAERFGADVLDREGGLDRPALGRLVFGDPAALRDLEALTHPAIWARTAQIIDDAGPDAVVVHDMPLLVEKGMGADYHLVIVVGAAEEVRVRRLVGPAGHARGRRPGPDRRAGRRRRASCRGRRVARQRGDHRGAACPGAAAVDRADRAVRAQPAPRHPLAPVAPHALGAGPALAGAGRAAAGADPARRRRRRRHPRPHRVDRGAGAGRQGRRRPDGRGRARSTTPTTRGSSPRWTPPGSCGCRGSGTTTARTARPGPSASTARATPGGSPTCTCARSAHPGGSGRCGSATGCGRMPVSGPATRR